MSTHITLANFTDQGVRNFKDSPKRAKAFMDLVEEMGGEVKGLYWTMGPYDVVAIIEGLDDMTATATALKVAALGNVRTTTLPAFGKEDIEKIINKAD